MMCTASASSVSRWVSSYEVLDMSAPG
jgi:hypothetical protein